MWEEEESQKLKNAWEPIFFYMPFWKILYYDVIGTGACGKERPWQFIWHLNRYRWENQGYSQCL